MVDLTSVEAISSAILAVIGIGGILYTIVSKRKVLRKSWFDFHVHTRDRLNQTRQSNRAIVFLMIISAGFGSALYFYVPTLTAQIIVLSFLGWLVIGGGIFGNPPEKEEVMTKSEVEELIQKRLKQELEKRT